MKISLFTSDLIICSSKPSVENRLIQAVKNVAESFRKTFDHWKYPELKNKGYDPLINHDFLNKETVSEWCDEYSEKMNYNWCDATCCAKGLFMMDVIKDSNIDFLYDNYTISFGGDIISTETSQLIRIDGTTEVISPELKPYFVFTSGNTDKRGEHILLDSDKRYNTVTVAGSLRDYEGYYGLPYIDAYATKSYASQRSYDIPVEGSFIKTLGRIWSGDSGICYEPLKCEEEKWFI